MLIKMDFSKLPKNFLWGTATSEYQVSGANNCPNANWNDWEKKGKTKDLSLSGYNHYNTYRSDVNLMNDLGVNAYRFSVEWSLIEPEEGVFNQREMNRYKSLSELLVSRGITPMVTLHHFTIPSWFEKKGGFEKLENIKHFVDFCDFVFSELKSCVKLWCTINEPGVYMLMGYLLGEFPPGIKWKFTLASKVLKHLLLSHERVYGLIKGNDWKNEHSVGIVHNYLKLEAKHSWNPIERIPCGLITKLVNDVTMNYLHTGQYKFYVPTVVNDIHFSNANCFDFIGLNYYSRAVITMSFPSFLSPTCRSGEVMTDMPYPSYPNGLYEAIVECTTTLGKPIYITENGIADATDDRRADFIEGYLAAMLKAHEEGCDVRGYFYWTLVDNFEWAEGYHMKFGLYEYNHITGSKRLRSGSIPFIRAIKSWNKM
jgi:beta-glucosidase